MLRSQGGAAVARIDSICTRMACCGQHRRVGIGVYSSGLLGVFAVGGSEGAAAPTASGPEEWEKRNAEALSSSSMKKGLKLFWFSTGKDDFLLNNTIATVDLFKKHGFTPVYKESAGGHTWLNWRDYLNSFAPQLFQ
jgi:hypothetical protein